MLWHEMDQRQRDKAVAEVLECEAAELATRHGIDPTRVHRIFERIVQDYGGQSFPDEVGRQVWQDGLYFGPSLDVALRYLPPANALALFEREDLRRLDERENVAYYLDDHVSFYTTEERADLADAFAKHLEDNRQDLASTGLPRYEFGMRWPGPFLRDLYPVKAFHSSRTAYYVGGREVPLTYPILYRQDSTTPVIGIRSYTWRRPLDPTPGVGEEPNSITRAVSWDESDWIPCTYEEAPLIDGLDPSDAARLDAGRSAMLDLEIRVLRRLAAALRARDATDLWPACLRLLTDALRADDAAYYLGIDRLLNSYDLRTGETTGEGDPDFAPGGLTNLLEVIGDCEKELTIGTMDRTRRALPPEGALDSLRSYYEAVGRPWQSRLDAALDLFVELEAREATFWDGFRVRVNEALENEFYAEVVVRIKVKQRLAATFEPYLRGFAEWQRGHLEATGALSPIQLTPLVLPHSTARNLFRRDGQVWTIEYDGKPVRLPDAKGLRYLAVLLAEPNREFHVLDLVRRVAGTPADQLRPLVPADQEELAGFDRSGWGFGDAGDQIDDQTRAGLRWRLQELPGEIDEKLAFGDADGADRLRAERDAILGYLAGAVGLGGRPRKAASTVDLARSAVTKRINDARKRIAANHPALGRHLRSVRTGAYCRYAPDSPVDWEV